MYKSFHLQSIIPESFQHHYDTVDKPLAEFAGPVAYQQPLDELDAVNEQPVGISRYTTEPWPVVLNHPRITSEIFDQCQFGQRNSKGHVKKPTELVASDADLRYYFQDLWCGICPKPCTGIHVEQTGHGDYKDLIWPWAFARRLVWGIVRLMKRKHWKQGRQGNNYH